MYTTMMELLKFFIILLRLNCVFGESVYVLEGNPVCLHTNVTDTQEVYLMWSFRSSIIAKLDGATQEISLYDVDEGIFEDRLQLDNRTGSLTINDIRTKHSGLYQLKIISDQTSIKTFTLTVQDVFFAGLENKREGDSVTLNTGWTEMNKHNLLVWMFGPLNPDVHLAEIRINTYNITYGFDERYTDRVHLNHESGSLTIRDLKPTDTGVYQLQITNNKETIYRRFNVFVGSAEPGPSSGFIVLICAAVLLPLLGILVVFYYRQKYSNLKDEMKTVSVMEGNSAKLTTGISETQSDQEIIWRFAAKVIARFQKKKDNVSYSDDERFRNKLHLNPETGDLTINDIKIPISGDYHLVITNRTKISKSKRFKVVVRVDTLKVTEGETVILQTGVSQLQNDEKIRWRYGPKETIIAAIDGRNKEKSFNTNDEEFKRRIHLNDQTGSLTITNIKVRDAGGYELHIKSRNTTSYKRFNVLVWFNTLKHTAGDSVTLKTEISELQADARILWTFGDKNTTIAEINRASGHVSVYDGNDERFRDRLKLNEEKGDLTITNISRGHSEFYNLQITTSAENVCKRFMLIANEKLESVMEGDSVTLQPDDADIQRVHVMMLWMFGPDDNLIAKADKRQKILYDGADGRFKGKLDLNKDSGSLTISNINTKHAGLYKLQIISNTQTKYKRFTVTVTVRGSRERDCSQDSQTEFFYLQYKPHISNSMCFLCYANTIRNE
ncbi:uncharacterized protein LOC130430126 [Triplophysa dalaica]|uniref:uncharacterized protein LOC130430126 n=1 Tax=Triplophysa dalaica TaxID=1582913 RepID=UPI0024DF48F9|nr:uncharacterized protein LOC130430126 [Triplophysa dalaica]